MQYIRRKQQYITIGPRLLTMVRVTVRSNSEAHTNTHNTSQLDAGSLERCIRCLCLARVAR